MYSCTSWIVYFDDIQIDEWKNVVNVVTKVGEGECSPCFSIPQCDPQWCHLGWDLLQYKHVSLMNEMTMLSSLFIDCYKQRIYMPNCH